MPQLRQLLLQRFPGLIHALPGEAGAGDPTLYGLGVGQGGERSGYPRQGRLSAPLLALQLLPLFHHRLRGLCRGLAEDVGVPVHQLFSDAVEHVFKPELALLLGDLDLKEHL